MSPPIAIIGGGPSGLTLGRLLEVAGIEYVVYESNESPDSHRQGGSLDIHPGSGQLALEKAGLLDQFKKIARYDAMTTKMADKHGNILLTLGGDDADRPEIDRKDLRALLLGSIPSSKVRWGCRVQCVEKNADDNMSVHFTDGSEASGFRLVVGADGAWSKVRSLVTSARPLYTGQQYLSTSIETTNPYHSTVASVVGAGTYMAVSDRKQLVVQGSGEGSYRIYAGVSLPETWNSEDPLAKDSNALRQRLLDDQYADWAPVNREMIRNSEGDFYAWKLYTLRPEDMSWKPSPGATLIGDAAHVAPPGGEGVNMAMHDAAQLAEQIIKFGMGKLDAAVAEYEKLMFPRAIEHIDASKRMEKFTYASDPSRGLAEWMEGEGFNQ